ncbi:hypothetical protein DL771_002623 [Monosporascus sp. 5C6A]|nr:hypothetical protein DL771_002623 [Monosporascus sp. 5C6A]
MATVNSTSDSRGNVAKIGDEFIDIQYLKPGTSVKDYEREPWKHCRDPTSAYLSLRRQYQSEFLRNLEEPQQRRVNRDLEKIKKVQGQFSSNANKKDLMEKLHRMKKEWRDEVARNLGNFEREKLKKLEAADKGVTAQPQGAARVPETAAPNPVEKGVKLEPLYGLKASAMYFELNGRTNTWVGYDYKHPKYTGRFPNQKISMHEILNEPNGNPLMEECPRDNIRYFHFPTNNMSWVETAIARYYREEPGLIVDHKAYDTNARKTDKLLAPLIIIDQCSRVFFDRTKPLDQRPEVMDLFASAIANITEMTTITYNGFWKALRTGNVEKKNLDLNPVGILFGEAQDIAEELNIMKRIYIEQLKVVKDFKRHIFDPLGKDSQGEIVLLKQLLLEMMKNQAASNDGSAPSEGKERDENAKKAKALEATLHDAEGTIELIESRQAEIQDLEDSALRTNQQLQGLLSLKQQQTSIVEAKTAIQQGRSIMALTIVTIFFLPLGFFAAFFGMNNAEINGSPWMTLYEQIGYMFGLSSIVMLFISIAFSLWMRAILRPILGPIPRIWYHILDGYTWVQIIWNNWLQDRKNCRLIGHKDGQGVSLAKWRGTAARRRERTGPQGDGV